MKFYLLILSFVCLSSSWAQKQTYRSRSEIGFLLGGSYYIGDLNQYGHFQNMHPAAGLLYRFNLNSRVVWRTNLSYGKVSGSDANSAIPVVKNRNLNFHSDIFELGSGVEFHYFPFQLGHPLYKASAYLLAEIAIFRMNPKTTFDGHEIELQPLGTEGQGSDLSSRGTYSRTQLSIPLAVGFKFSIGKSMTIGLEYGIRKTFTDYIDDIKSDRYVNSAALAAANGPLAAQLANRSIDQSDYGKRGNVSTKDWYTFFGAMVTFRLGGPKKCAQP